MKLQESVFSRIIMLYISTMEFLINNNNTFQIVFFFFFSEYTLPNKHDDPFFCSREFRKKPKKKMFILQKVQWIYRMRFIHSSRIYSHLNFARCDSIEDASKSINMKKETRIIQQPGQLRPFVERGCSSHGNELPRSKWYCVSNAFAFIHSRERYGYPMTVRVLCALTR